MRGRPAETAGGVGAVGLLMAHVLGVTDPDTIACIGSGLLLVPAAVSLLVDGGGVRGVLASFWRGRAKSQG